MCPDTNADQSVPPLPPQPPPAFSPPVPPSFPRRRARSRGPLPFLALGCGGALLLALLIGGAVIGGLYAGSKVVDPVVDAFLQQVNDGRFGEAYAGLHPRFRETTPPEQFELFMRGVVDALGPYTSKSIRGINVNSANGVTTTVATYAMTFERGTATGTFTLTNGQIVRFDIDSPLVRSALECPHCGQTLDAFGNFCPHCGKPLTEAEETV